MDHAPPSDTPNSLWHRSRAAFHDLVRVLGETLPPPLADTADSRRRRDHAAIAAVAALLPVNAAEANLAAQHVAANAQGMACLRLANDPGAEPAFALKCVAQAAGMMRQSQGALRLLLRIQAARQKQDADFSTGDAALWTEHRAGETMLEALAGFDSGHAASNRDGDCVPVLDGEAPDPKAASAAESFE